MKSYTTISLGCKVNSYELTALTTRLNELGYVEDNINPTVAIINTCSVTSTADQKSRQHIRKLINNYPNAIVVVMGCYSQGQHKFIKDEIKANIITGTSNRDKLVEYIESLGGKTSSSVSAKTSYLINNDITSTSGKNKKAKELGVPIITEEEFINMTK